MKIDGYPITSEQDPFFIAEAGVNHNGSVSTAKELIDVAANAGVDAVKFQTFSADRLVSKDASTAEYQAENTGEADQYEMLKRYELDRSAHESLIEYCSDKDVIFLSTPFDSESANMLEALGVSAMKIGSGELDNHPLLEHIANIGLPTIISTGMGTMQEIHDAYDAIRSTNPGLDIAFLHCTSAYPTNIEDVNLRAMNTMQSELPTPVGLSDHTTLPETPALATAAGASILEKHFTLDATLPGPDHEASLEPTQLRQAVEKVKIASQARGKPEKQPVESELPNRTAARKSLHAAIDLEAGTELTASHIKIIRPASGLSPSKYKSVLGTKLKSNLKKDEPIEEDSIK